MLCVNPAHHYRATAISAIRHRGACWQSGTKWLHVLILKLCWAYLDLVWKSVETSVADRLMLMLFLCYSYKWHICVRTNLSAENLQKDNTNVLAKKQQQQKNYDKYGFLAIYRFVKQQLSGMTHYLDTPLLCINLVLI